uniref:Uncharacterized protein n=1 Tax=viral metagenome TaxID=1070528 RepID=A0A6M3ILN1_9ZZZZ
MKIEEVVNSGKSAYSLDGYVWVSNAPHTIMSFEEWDELGDEAEDEGPKESDKQDEYDCAVKECWWVRNCLYVVLSEIRTNTVSTDDPCWGTFPTSATLIINPAKVWLEPCEDDPDEFDWTLLGQ